MALDLRQNLRLSQQLLMTPQLRQAIKLLQYSRLELEGYLAQQLEENPVLELGNPDNATSSVDREASTFEGGLDQGGKKESSEGVESRYLAANKDAHTNYEQFVAQPTTLAEHLWEQMYEVDFTDEEKRLAVLIIGNLSDKGYLEIELSELASAERSSYELAEGVLDVIQHFDPPGVAARNLQECLLLQVRERRWRNTLEERILLECFEQLKKVDFAGIAKALDVEEQEVARSIRVLGELEVNPGRPFHTFGNAVVVPEVFVVQMGKEWVVYLNEDIHTRLQINPYYKGLLKKSKESKDYLGEKIKEASWLIKSLEQRQKTILRVARKIVERQQDFFNRGVNELKPMVLRDIAEDIEVHESTVSRVTSGKFMQTPRGVFELKYFFNRSLATQAGETGAASESVKI